ncbi:PLP-dependent aminotransferase family protein [Roseateles sp.]|uniref:aminotransferase-like domain-containing protein n=1 Tax=Roseateles sp. TaxID=1971397 RepID=UPI0031E14861
MAEPRYKAVVDQLAQDIRAGAIAAGTRLPTHRELAQREGIALVTATRVYAELRTMGLISGETGRGTFVKETALAPGQGVDLDAVAADMVDLSFNYPSLPGQAELLRGALRQLAGAGDLEALLRYQPHGGRLADRAAIARHLVRRGLSVEAERVMIVDGAQHGLAVTLMALLEPGDVVAVDALTYPGFRLVAEMQRLELVAVPAAGAGPDLGALETLCRRRRVKAIYTMPTLNNPLGWVMAATRRRELVAIARRHGLLIVEDGAYAYLAKDPPPPLAMLAPERTVYVSGFSKSVAAGLRVGFAVAPPDQVRAMARAIRATTWNTPGVMTAITAGWLEDGTVARLEDEKRADATRRQRLAAERLGPIKRIGHPSSYFVWLPLGEAVRADQVAMALQRERVSVSTAEPFAAGRQVPHAIRLALGSVEIGRLRSALDLVRAAIEARTF